MSSNPDGSTFATSDIPARAEVYRSIRLRIRNLRDLRKQQRELTKPQNELSMMPEEVRIIYEQYASSVGALSRFTNMNDDGGNSIAMEAAPAWAWLLEVLDCHESLFTRDSEMRMFRSAIEKKLAGRDSDLTEREVLYMALSDGDLAASERVVAGFAIVLHYSLATRLRDVSEQARIRLDQLQRAKARDDELEKIRDVIAERAENVLVDHFACAIPVQETRKATLSIIDDNAGCCPICQSSYTNLSTSIHELLSDFPVRIKYCGHVFGKACLEQWMITPKIDEARHPFRKCPTCRVQIEGVARIPSLPPQLLHHLKSNARALATVRDLTQNFGMDLDDCLNAVKQAMSDEIAAEQLLAELPAMREMEKELLRAKLEEVEKQRWAWGFRGDQLWRGLRDEWMQNEVQK